MNKRLLLALAALLFIALPIQSDAIRFRTVALAQTKTIPAPSDVLGFTPGDDRKLASATPITVKFEQLRPGEGYDPRKESFTSREANKLLGRRGQFWMEDYFDRYVRDRKHFVNAIAYIENNPVKARLCAKPEDWPFSSAWFRSSALSA